jgi:hypothetical protein
VAMGYPWSKGGACALALRSIGSNDYAVIDDGDRVGRIRLAAERRGEVWMWNIGLNIPDGVPSGTATSMEEAKAAFREAWTRFKAGIEPSLYAEAIEEAKAARDRRPTRGIR